MGRKKPSARDEETAAAVPQCDVKSKKKTAMIDNDEYSVQEELSGRIGKKKGNAKAGKSKFEDGGEEKVVDGEDGVSDIAFSRKKSKSNKGEEADAEVDSFSGKKKKSFKSSKGSTILGFGVLGDDDGGEVVDDYVGDGESESPAIAFEGKTKSSKSVKKGASVYPAVDLDEYDGMYEKINEKKDGDEDVGPVTFPGKKKKSGHSVAASGGGEVVDGNADADTRVPEIEQIKETSKTKKKKKNGRTAREEDDLDKILAELGEETSTYKSVALPPQEDKTQTQPRPIAPSEKEGEQEAAESAAAKKKKKRKEKEKEKKLAEIAESKQNDARSKVADKKIPKHVREIQEALARRKEAELRKKMEEEEKLRKEEEERRKQEEDERQAEEARRRKKEREKEKLMRKRQEGTLLTGKQKEEARRREAMRNQILANAGGLPLPTADSGGAPTKRPMYRKKKSKAAQDHASGASSSGSVKAVENEEPKDNQQDSVTEVENVNVDVKGKAGIVDEEEDEDKWDAKSWDDVNLSPISTFADEEANSEPEHVDKKEIGAPTAPKPAIVVKKAIPQSSISNDVGPKKSHPQVEAAKNKKKLDDLKKVASSSGATSEQGEIDLRSPICCIMGHVDTGKTKLLDRIRGTNVQGDEAGGITQQIGATYFPAVNIREKTKELKADATMKVPGLLIIDTPGHESFTNLRSRGSGLCDIAILVVDIMHGLEPQTIESLNLLKMRNTEFIVALNKVDRLYGWKTCSNSPIVKAIKQQTRDVQNEFNMRLAPIIMQFKEQGLNTELYYKNKEMGETISIVPTSAINGEGIADMLLLLVQWTQKTMTKKLTFTNEVQCTVLDVKVVEGHGTTIDVVLVNGVLHEGDQIVVCGLQGPIVTTIRALLTPHPMKELRVKGTYLHHKEIKAAQGIKITAQGLEHAIAGTGLYVVGLDDDVEAVKRAAMEDIETVMSRIEKSGEGVCVQASTLGSLEALLELLKSPAVKIPVSGINIGPVHKKDVMRAGVMLGKKKEYATILAFDVKVTPEAREVADDAGVKIFTADIIYNLVDKFKAYIDDIREERKKKAADEAVFPCILKIIPGGIFNAKDPILLGVDVIQGVAKVGTPICISSRNFIDIGRIVSIMNNNRSVNTASKGEKVSIKIVGSNGQKVCGKPLGMDDELVSHISRRSIDALKSAYRNDGSVDWMLVVDLKKRFGIP